MKSKQLPLIEKCIYLTILSVNSLYKFSEMYVSYIYYISYIYYK